MYAHVLTICQYDVNCICIIWTLTYFSLWCFIQPHLSLWCLHNPELAEHFNECHFSLHMCQPHANAVSRPTPKWDEGTRVDGGLLGLAEPAAKGGI